MMGTLAIWWSYPTTIEPVIQCAVIVLYHEVSIMSRRSRDESLLFQLVYKLFGPIGAIVLAVGLFAYAFGWIG